ncbi:hypothetical protein [Dickeya ananatis]|uniref:hypothetical protein n=1 Tax=Dickeya ananatis TaxID=3061286 RepID=UPI00388F3AA5
MQFSLLPIDLGMNRSRPLDRGLPQRVSHQEGHAIAASLTTLSERYGTVLQYSEASGLISVVS